MWFGVLDMKYHFNINWSYVIARIRVGILALLQMDKNTLSELGFYKQIS